MNKAKGNPDTATAWGICRTCRSPGLALVAQFERTAASAAVCGFCGGPLDRVADDLSEMAAAVIAAPVRGRRTGARTP
jgi:hypothetical protein